MLLPLFLAVVFAGPTKAGFQALDSTYMHSLSRKASYLEAQKECGSISRRSSLLKITSVGQFVDLHTRFKELLDDPVYIDSYLEKNGSCLAWFGGIQFREPDGGCEEELQFICEVPTMEL